MIVHLLVAAILSLVLGSYQVASSQELRIATHYHRMYVGGTMSCGGTYTTEDTTIIALSYADKANWPCNTLLTVSGPVGSIAVKVSDTCGGCTNQVDLSEAGQIAVCGTLGNNCGVYVQER